MAESDKTIENDSKQNLRGVYPWDNEEQATVPATETTFLLPEATATNQRKRRPSYPFIRKFIDDTKYNMILLSKAVLYGMFVMYLPVMLRFINSKLAPHQGKYYKRFMIND
jgi:hypothetical protein